MSYIGNTSTTQAFTPAVDYFSGNASTTAFTLSRPVASVAQVQVVVNNVAQNPSSAYTISSNTITFTSAPSSGTNNIYVYYTSPITQVIAPGQGTVTATSFVSSTGTGAGVFQTSPTITTPVISSLSSASATALTLQSAGTTAVTVDTSQRVGIGTTSPSANLEVKGASGQNIYVSYTSGSQLRLKSDSGDSGVGTTGSTPLLFLVNNGEVARFNSSGNILCLAGGSTSATGTGIAFPATQSASSDANTLDDYEEGTFTPTAYGSTTAGTTTYTVQQGSYTKIGRQVTVSTRVDYSAMTGTGEIRFGGFPFTSANDSMEYTGAVVTNNLNWTTGSAIGIYYGPNSTFCVIFNIGDDIAWGSQQCVNEAAGARMTFTYFV